MPDVAEIAGTLGKVDLDAILRLDRDWRFLPLAYRPNRLHPVIERWNRPYGGFNYRLTPLGLAVRAYLEKSREQ